MRKRPILLVTNGGYGETPVPADALLQPGDVMTITDENDGTKSDAKVIAVVPVGVEQEIAIADQTGQPRPLMLTVPRHKEPLYVIAWRGQQVVVPHRQIRRGLRKAKEAGL